jgi:nanoRNase/pAp phosphatase (c-di-AMP/oligoRNAs hydrolase)
VTEPESGSVPAPTREQTERLSQLLDAVDGADRLLVLTHDNPDPDALAAAASLAFLVREEGKIATTVVFGGIVGRAENRALIQEMGLEFRGAEALEEASAAPVALVDTQPRAGNNSLPPGRIASIVLDHHPRRSETTAATFEDVRPEYGASCSLLVEYLRAAGLEPGSQLATALFYGIQSETMDLGRETSPADIEASMYLYPRSDPEAISRIRHARVPAGYFRSMHDALASARRHGGVVTIPLGVLPYPDMVAEMADLFMKMAGVEWAIASGRHRDTLLLSVRTYDASAHAGELVQEAVGDRGSAGGHGTLAGGQVDVRQLSDDDVAALQEKLIRDLLSSLGVADEPLRPLVPEDGLGQKGAEE